MKLSSKFPLAAAVLVLAACSKVPAGYVGVKVDQYADKGVQPDVVGPGQYFTGWNTTIYTFPTFMQNYTWTASANEGKAADESFTFQTKDGVSIGGDFGVTFQINPAKVADVFQKYREGVDEIRDVYLHNMARDALNEAAGALTLDELNANRQSFIDAANKAFMSKAAANDITTQGLTLIGSFRYPQNIVTAMNNKLEAVQNALTVENQVKQTQWEQQKLIVKSEAEITIAQNEAKAAQIRGDALRANPQLLQQQEIEHWNGQVPAQFGAGPMPILKLLDQQFQATVSK